MDEVNVEVGVVILLEINGIHLSILNIGGGREVFENGLNDFFVFVIIGTLLHFGDLHVGLYLDIRLGLEFIDLDLRRELLDVLRLNVKVSRFVLIFDDAKGVGLEEGSSDDEIQVKRIFRIIFDGSRGTLGTRPEWGAVFVNVVPREREEELLDRVTEAFFEFEASPLDAVVKRSWTGDEKKWLMRRKENEKKDTKEE